MSEDDYIKATNLAKLRIAHDILRDLYGFDFNDLLKVVYREIIKLEESMNEDEK